MEIKDKSYLKKQLKDEYDAICKTAFWKDYIARLEIEKKIATSHCVTDPAEDVPRYQGTVRAYKSILRLPLEVIEVTPIKVLQED